MVQWRREVERTFLCLSPVDVRKYDDVRQADDGRDEVVERPVDVDRELRGDKRGSERS